MCAKLEAWYMIVYAGAESWDIVYAWRRKLGHGAWLFMLGQKVGTWCMIVYAWRRKLGHGA